MHVQGIKATGTMFAVVALLAILVATVFVYRPGLYGPFLFDDLPNVVNNQAIRVSKLTPETLKQAAFSSDSGPLRRPVSMVSFALNYYFTKLNQFYFKATNLVIHLLNGIGLFVLSSLLLRHYRHKIQPALTGSQATWIALAASAAWLLHPLNLTGVLYVVQRMTSLSAMFCIVGLALFVWGRIRLLDRRGGMLAILAGLLLFTPLAALSKETGALLPLFMLVTEFTLFDFQTCDSTAQRWLIIFYALSVGVPALATLVYIIVHPAWLMGGYLTREFDLPQRVMTEGRVLWFYLKQILLPNTAAMGLYHDDFGISRGLLRPSDTLPALLGIVLLPIVAIAFRKRAPMLAFGILFYLAGQLLESTIFPLELVFEHRNYLPMFGIVLAMFYYLQHPAYPDTLPARRVLSVLMIGLFAYGTLTRAQEWADPYDFSKWELLHHPDSPRANGEMGNVLASIHTPSATAAKANARAAKYYYSRATRLNADYTNGLFGLVTLGSSGKIPMDPSWLTELASRLRHASYSGNDNELLIALVTCRIKGACKLAPDDFRKLFDATLSNPTCQGTDRSMVYSAKSYYLINVAKDYEGGLTSLQEMIRYAPDMVQNRVTMVKYYIFMHRFQAARKEMFVLERMDTDHVFTKEITHFKKLLQDKR